MIGRRVGASSSLGGKKATVVRNAPSRADEEEEEEEEGDGTKRLLKQGRKGWGRKRRGKREVGNDREETEAKRKDGHAGQNKHKMTKPRFRDPLPMKMRALPQSFWQQPNLAPSSAPGGSVCALPPLPLPILLEKGSAEDQVGKGMSSGGVSDGEVRHREEVVSAANTDLLFSLFRGVEKVAAEARRNNGYDGGREGGGGGEDGGGGGNAPPPRPIPAKRGRPRKTNAWGCSSSSAGGSGGAAGVRDDDPCLVSAVADSIRPLLPSQDPAAGQQVLAMVTLPEADGAVSLPTLDVQHNYSQILSKLVMKL